MSCQENSTTYIERHLKNKNFTILDNALMRHPTMSPNARTVLFWLLSWGDNWQIKTKKFIKSMPISKNSIYKAISELMSLGYMQRVEHKVKNLRRDVSYKCADYPAFEKIPLKQSLYEKKKNSNNVCRNPKFRNHEKCDDNKEPITSPTASLKHPPPPPSVDRSENKFSSLSPDRVGTPAGQQKFLAKDRNRERERHKKFYASTKETHPQTKSILDRFTKALLASGGKFSTIPSLWANRVSEMLYGGVYSVEELNQSIDFAFKDSFWRLKISTPIHLLNNIDLICKQSKALPEKKNDLSKSKIIHKKLVSERNEKFLGMEGELLKDFIKEIQSGNASDTAISIFEKMTIEERNEIKEKKSEGK